MKRLLTALVLAAPAPVIAAPTLSMPPSAHATAEEVRPLESYAMPIGPWHDGKLPAIEVRGEVTRTAWRIREGDTTTLAVMNRLREQLVAEGFEILFECESEACGGFDFRYSTEILPEPDMHVDLGDFRYLAARRDAGATKDHFSLLVSRSADSAWVQMIRVGAPISDPTPLARARFTADDAAADPERSVTDTLVALGRVVLDDLEFASGTTSLRPGDYRSLAALAAYLNEDRARHVTLVGHTDADGPLEANVVISRKRAEAVRRALIDRFGVNPDQIATNGIGWLSPIASNMTEEGRARNRRVEALLTAPR
ncbi:OOP family OmpA-OmpF porin [Albidovulum inexpectatum]|uniref:OOP family OmpA-OmpF porin n=1 Tax=Albidovulum inexpectatum TaxID=196587 RepID=A0A2S5JLN6_9RHOB|nr:OmpA family protein [Albidovulum inexpectatum]PPB82399.1 OOP family OmpA-OmpF porin [Albidovulum inexpectatum]